MALEYVELEAAKGARGTRLVVTSLVPSPWSEAAKGCFRIGGVKALVVRRGFEAAQVDQWSGIDNVPAVLHEREPVRSSWAAIVGLVDRLARAAGGRGIVPAEPAARAAAFGVLNEIAGEEGIGWNGRLAMIEAGLSSHGARGFPLPVAKFLAKRYGHSAAAVESAGPRVEAQLAFLAERLGAAPFFGGEAPDARDAYCATFLTPIVGPISEEECPQLAPVLRQAFAAAHEAFGRSVPAALVAHRARMFGAYLPLPIEL